MDIKSIVAELKKERDRLDRAIAALDGEAGSNEARRAPGRGTRGRAGEAV